MTSELQAKRARSNRRRWSAGASPPRSRFRGDDGTALLEAAFISPIFLVMLFGTLEYGGLMRDYLTVNNASAGAGRAGAIAGATANADYSILQAIKKESAAMPSAQIRRIVVFHAQDATTAVPTGCASGTATVGSGSPNYTLACNVYNDASLALPENPYFVDCDLTPVASPQRFWCPTVRKDAAKATNGNGPPDWLGVYIEAFHPFFTGFFGSGRTITSTTVVRLEPQTLV